MKIKCNFCNSKCIKNGFQSNGNQRYKCCVCQKRQQFDYGYNAYKNNINQDIILLTKEGLGIRSTARILQISTTTVLKRIIAIAKNIQQPIISKGKTYEVDEMCTYIPLLAQALGNTGASAMPLARAGKVKSTKKLKQETSPIGEVSLCFSRCKNSKESCVFFGRMPNL